MLNKTTSIPIFFFFCFFFVVIYTEAIHWFTDQYLIDETLRAPPDAEGNEWYRLIDATPSLSSNPKILKRCARESLMTLFMELKSYVHDLVYIPLVSFSWIQSVCHLKPLIRTIRTMFIKFCNLIGMQCTNVGFWWTVAQQNLQNPTWMIKMSRLVAKNGNFYYFFMKNIFW